MTHCIISHQILLHIYQQLNPLFHPSTQAGVRTLTDLTHSIIQLPNLHVLSYVPLLSKISHIWHHVNHPQVPLHSSAPSFSFLVFLGDLIFKNPSYPFLVDKSIIRCNYLFWLCFDCFLSLLATRQRRQWNICSCFHIFILPRSCNISSLSTFAHQKSRQLN